MRAGGHHASNSPMFLARRADDPLLDFVNPLLLLLSRREAFSSASIAVSASVALAVTNSASQKVDFFQVAYPWYLTLPVYPRVHLQAADSKPQQGGLFPSVIGIVRFVQPFGSSPYHNISGLAASFSLGGTWLDLDFS